MHEVGDARERAVKALAVADGAEEEPKARVLALGELRPHLGLLQLVAAEDDEAPQTRIAEQRGGQAAPERARASGDQEALPVELAQKRIHVESLLRGRSGESTGSRTPEQR